MPEDLPASRVPVRPTARPPVRAPAVPWAQRADPRYAVRTAVVWDALQDLLSGRSDLDVVDVGGGTGGFAVLLADLGHRVTVVDPSPDALAALQRRAAEAGVADRVRAEQGEAGALAAVVGRAGADVVLCHGVLEHVEDPRAAVADALDVLRPGGLLSLLVAQRLGAVLARALAGRFAEARRLLEGRGLPPTEGREVPQTEGRGIPARRFDREQVLALLDDGRTRVRAVQGVRFVTDLLPGALVDGGDGDLLDLERAASARPDLAALAAQLHVAVELTP